MKLPAPLQRLVTFAQHLNTLSLALGISVALHAGLLTVRFVHPEAFNRVFQDTPLEVILVNAQSKERPEHAQAIAQANLAGGGDAAKGRASSPLPYSALTSIGDDLEDEQRQMEQMLERQSQMLAQLRQELAKLPPTDPRTANQQTDQVQREEKRQQLIQLLAEIEKRINEENSRPRKRFVSPATREEAFAIYYDALRRRVEDKGTQHFPEVNGKKLYGELIMIITVNHDGRVLETEIVQSSGIPALDRRAEAIARLAGPFGHFGPAMRNQTEQIAVVSRFRFTRDQQLQTEVR